MQEIELLAANLAALRNRLNEAKLLAIKIKMASDTINTDDLSIKLAAAQKIKTDIDALMASANVNALNALKIDAENAKKEIDQIIADLAQLNLHDLRSKASLALKDANEAIAALKDANLSIDDFKRYKTDVEELLAKLGTDQTVAFALNQRIDELNEALKLKADAQDLDRMTRALAKAIKAINARIRDLFEGREVPKVIKDLNDRMNLADAELWAAIKGTDPNAPGRLVADIAAAKTEAIQQVHNAKAAVQNMLIAMVNMLSVKRVRLKSHVFPEDEFQDLFDQLQDSARRLGLPPFQTPWPQ